LSIHYFLELDWFGLDAAASEDKADQQRRLADQARHEESWRRERDGLLSREISKHALEVEKNIERSWDLEAEEIRRKFEEALSRKTDEAAADMTLQEKEVRKTLLRMDEDRRQGRAADALIAEQGAQRSSEQTLLRRAKETESVAISSARRAHRGQQHARVELERQQNVELGSLQAELQRDSSLSSDDAPFDGVDI
jgi:hypothetical protein